MNESTPSEFLVDHQGWDEYWQSKDKKRGKVYDTVAEFYRKHIIRPSLNHFIRKYFVRGASLLHAGCGSGQVDADIRHYVSITGLDLSQNALAIYRRENGELCKTLHGSIFQIPLPDQTMDGVYNLGVLEHFNEAEIAKILKEFRRVLKEDGKLVAFWPPEFGASVLFFKGLKTTLEFAFRRPFKFHPDEICRLRSKQHAYAILERAGFEVLEYAFGFRDYFTYSVVVARPAR